MGEASRAGADQLRVEHEAWTMAFLRAYPGLVFQKVDCNETEVKMRVFCRMPD